MIRQSRFMLLSSCAILFALVHIFVDIQPLNQKKAIERQCLLKHTQQPIYKSYLQGTEAYVTFFSREDIHGEKLKRHGVLLTRPKAQATVIMGHGFTMNKNDMICLRHIFKDYNVLLYDFRAHGDESANHWCSLGHDEKYDVMGAVDFIRNYSPTLRHLPIIGFGFSMGAVATLLAQAEDPTLFKALILDSPYDSLQGVTQRVIDGINFEMAGYPIPGKSFLRKHCFHPHAQSLLTKMTQTNIPIRCHDPKKIDTNPLDAIKKITVPLFIVSCIEDAKVPPEPIEKLWQTATSPIKHLWITNGRRHGSSYFFSPKRYTTLMRNFVKNLLSHSLERRVIMDDRKEHPGNLPTDPNYEHVRFYAQKSLDSNDTLLTNGIIWHAEEAKAIVIISSEFMADKYDLSLMRSIFKNYHCMTFDFRGHGIDLTQYCPLKATSSSLGFLEKYEVKGAVEYLKQRPDMKDLPIIIFGMGMGATAALLAQAEDPTLCQALILDTPYDDTQKLLQRAVEQLQIGICGSRFSLPGRHYLKQRCFDPMLQNLVKRSLRIGVQPTPSTEIDLAAKDFSTLKSAELINIPTFVISALHDEKMPPTAVHEVFTAINGSKDIWLAPGRCHCDAYFYNPEEYCHRVRMFINSFLESISHEKSNKLYN